MDVRVGVVHVGAAAQLPEVLHGLLVDALALLRAHRLPVLGRLGRVDHLHSQAPEVRGGVLVAPLQHGVVRELLDHLQREVRTPRLLVRVEGIVEAVIEGEPLRPGEVDLRRVLRMLLAQRERLVPAVGLHVQGDEHAHVAHLDDGLLREGVVLMGPEGLHGLLQQARLVLRELPDHLDQAVQGADLDEDLHRLPGLPRREVHLARRAEVAVLLGGGRLLQDEALRNRLLGSLRARRGVACGGGRDGAHRVRDGLQSAPAALLALLRPVLRLVPLPQLRVHLHGHVVLLRAAEVLRRLGVLALEGQDLRGDQLLLLVREVGAVPVLVRDPVEQINVPHVADANEGLARDVEVLALQGVERQESPVGLRDAEAGDPIGRLEVLLLDVPVQRRALRHVDGLHRDVVEAEDLRALEAHDEALQLLHVRREVPRLDAQHVAAAVGQHVLHLRVPGHAISVRLLVHQSLRREVVHEQVGRLVHHGQLVAPAREVEAADGRGLLDQGDREVVVHKDLHDVAVLQTHQQALALGRAADHLDVADQRVQVPLTLQHSVEGVELQLALLAEDDVVRGDHEQGADELLLDLLYVLVVHV
mmetsp:Transcript_9414/g.27996  ORF Transcript_9414/g.27996 Transcript_9414/m.27996 type:complete len:589 (+) Transcript_9414:1058-2824(+)